MTQTEFLILPFVQKYFRPYFGISQEDKHQNEFHLYRSHDLICEIYRELKHSGCENDSMASGGEWVFLQWEAVIAWTVRS